MRLVLFISVLVLLLSGCATEQLNPAVSSTAGLCATRMSPGAGLKVGVGTSRKHA